MSIAIIKFPGSAGHEEIKDLIQSLGEETVEFLDHNTTNLSNYQAVILSGGASYGDSIAPGAAAAQDPVGQAVKDFADKGGLVLGLGNGFQILSRLGLLPGGFLLNKSSRAINGLVNVVVENSDSVLTSSFHQGQVLKLPVAHKYGNYFVDEETLSSIKQEKGLLLTYQENINGSTENIAGLQNQAGNVIGLMVKPERACEDVLGSTDGLEIFKAFLSNLQARKEG